MVISDRSTLQATGPVGPAIRDFPTEERPRERLRNRGPANLSNPELMAILLRTGLEGENVVSMASAAPQAVPNKLGVFVVS